MAHIKPFKAAIPILDNIPDKETYFETAKEHFPQSWNKGLYTQLDQNAFFVYEIKKPDRSHTGLVATVDIRDYLKGHIVRHEKTLAAKRNQMLDLFYQREAHIKPALLVYRNESTIDDLIEDYKKTQPVLYSTEFKGAAHTFWIISDDKEIDKLVRLFKEKISCTYIADGHHRTEATAILYRKILKLYGEETEGRPYQRILCALYSSGQLAIHEFNRVIKTLNNYSEKGFKAELRKYFIIKKQGEPFQPSSKHEIGMYISRKWYKLEPKQKLLSLKDQFVDRLDVTLLNKLVMKQILQIKDISNDPRISYVEGPKGLKSLERKVGKNHHAVAFSLYPVSLEELLAIADAEETMPPKSTWFEPRMRNGFIVSHFSKLM